jgi:serine/threonine protein phosphatase PrpC
MRTSRPGVGSRYYIEILEPTAEKVELGLGDFAVFTAASPLHPERNEDGAAIFALEDCVVVAVADGVGGLPDGAGASSLALQSLGEALDELTGEPDARQVRNALLDAFEAGHREIQGTGAGGATTLAVIEVRAGQVRTYHAGDSTILIVGRGGERRFQSVAHSPVGYALESGLIDEHDALAHPQRNVIFNCLGLPRMAVEIGSPIGLETGDTILLASDGLFDNLTLDEIASELRRATLGEVCDALCALARQRMVSDEEGVPSKPDDLTFALFRAR